MIPAWLDDLSVAVGEEELRSALETAIEAGDLGEHLQHREELRKIVRGPASRFDLRRAARRRAR